MLATIGHFASGIFPASYRIAHIAIGVVACHATFLSQVLPHQCFLCGRDICKGLLCCKF